MPERASSLSLVGDALELRRVQPGRQLVDQQQPRAGRERAGEIEHFLLRAVEFAGRLIGERGEIERRQ